VSGRELPIRVGSTLAEVERRLILATLDEFRGDKRRTAQALGIGLKTLYTHLSVYRAAGHAAGVDARTATPNGPDADGRAAPFVESALPNSPDEAPPVETEPAKS